VPHENIASYYSLIDVFVVSRPDLPVTRLVTPLKPLEAMAFGRAVIVSDLPALLEVVDEGTTGLTYPAGDEIALARKCEQLLSNPAARQRIGRAGREWIINQRTWPKVVERYGEVYSALERKAVGLR
jgi:glycosyltransferase involved in cell wall biosynthesis